VRVSCGLAHVAYNAPIPRNKWEKPRSPQDLPASERPCEQETGLSLPIGGGTVDYAGEAGVAGHSLSAEEAWTGCGLTLRSEKFQRCVRTRMVGAGDCGVRCQVGEQRHVVTVARITTAISHSLAGT
jgi:hypothetical protein